MSRCLPFSDEAYANRRLNHEALIKLHKEKIKVEWKRERKLKKKEQKDEDKRRHKYGTSDGKVIKPCHKKHSSSQYPFKGNESDQSEKSGVSEELNPPTYSGSICNIVSGGVENTLKRKRQDDLFDGIESPRTALRIRFSVKRSGSNSSLIEQGQNCLSRERKEQPIVQMSCTKTNSVKPERPSNKPAQINSQNRKKLTMYELMIAGWVPPSSEDLNQNIIEDEDWLFGSRNKRRNQDSKQHKSCHGEKTCSRTTTLWPPQAIYLLDADVNALPYTALF